MNCPLTKGIFSRCHFYEIPFFFFFFFLGQSVAFWGRAVQTAEVLAHPASKVAAGGHGAGSGSFPYKLAVKFTARGGIQWGLHQWGTMLLKSWDPRQHP